ncbi:DUF433 domain-containing protein [Hymenobacter sp. YC55]|uniref:DUF433 domain-containing protein n=1 Tax=Hymenobacter sp. YC55 TaxID=3034019 RepID=UPI0023F75CAE|nr:DUF433 domain-containing protein [Hymenobacter sp. YC55]
MKYFKRYWNETTGNDLTDSWGASYYYFETNDQLNVVRQLQLFEKGQVLKYNTEYLEDNLGGLAEVPLEEEFELFQIKKEEFEQLWLLSNHNQFPEIVLTEKILWGQPRLDGRRLAVGDIVSQVDMNDSIHVAAEDYGITLQQIKQALHYCRTLQCVKDSPIKFYHNCTLRVQQEGEADGEEQDNWKRADRLYKEHFTH